MFASNRVAASGAATRQRRSRGLAAVTTLLLGCAIALFAPTLFSAEASEAPSASEPPATSQATTSLLTTPEPTATAEPIPKAVPEVAASPAITSPGTGQFIGSNNTSVSGTKSVDQEIQLLSPFGADPLCIVADATTSWSCENVYLPDGPTITLRVVVTGDSSLSDEMSVAVLGAPTMLGGRTSDVSDGWVRGTAYPQATVTASLSNGARCTSSADTSGAWACLFSGLDDGSWDVTASQSTTFSSPSTSNSSAPVTIVFDVTAPDAPVVSTPSTGAQIPVTGTEYSGTGETGAVVTVFAGPYSLCSAPVNGTLWSCSAGEVAAGSYSIMAVQQDPAGNVGPSSTPIAVSYVAATTPTPTPTASAAATPPGTQPGTPAPSESASATPDDSAVVPAVPAPPSSGPDSAEPTPDDATAAPEREEAGASVFRDQWNDPTRFAATIGPTANGSPFPWMQAALLALGAMLLIALPLRMLAGTISRARGGRPLGPLPSLAGRNREKEEFEVAPTVKLNRWTRGGAALVAAATFVMLSGPVVDQPAYLRLLAGVIIGLVLVNAVAILVPLWWSSRVLGLHGSATFLPRYLLIIAAAAIASRLFDVHPALLFGLLGSVMLTAKTDAAGQAGAQPTPAQSGQLALVRVGSLIVLAVLAWSLGALLPSPTDFVTSLAAETVNTIVLTSIGSAVLVLVPVGHTSGRSMLAWSWPLWTSLTVLTYTLLFGALAPVVEQLQSDGGATVLWIVAAAFATLCGSVWVWQRFVAPNQR
ncbi:hypothetical protein [Cryobacterium sp. Y11]|uniref:hypothetical protein n=1 Tax=Cryobacterium sp. Y11 TaxID=2045016 RepID=UPI000CE31ED9|nr:hypothetical protein [Cryobacterium sp. Y11]